MHNDFDFSKLNPSVPTYILLSGGADSTLCLDEFLNLYPLTRLTPVYIKHHLVNQAKIEKELKTVKNILHRYNRVEDLMVITIDGDNVTYPFSGGNYQAGIWLSCLTYLPKKSNLIIGYMRSDDIFHNPEYYEVLEAMSNLYKIQVNLVLPVQWLTKVEIIYRLHRRRLYNMICYCEDTKDGQPCLECKPCLSHKNALIELYLIYGCGWALDYLNLTAKELNRLNIFADIYEARQLNI